LHTIVVTRTADLSLFEIVTGFKFRQPINLVPMTHHSRVSDSASAFASHIRALHEEIREKIMKNNVDHKAFVDLHRRLRTNVSDYVMVRMRLDRLSSRTMKKLHARSAGPF